MAHVLLIESDKILAANTSKALKRAGNDVEWHVDPQFALEKADLKLPDVIVLDLLLAKRGGVEFLYEFRSYPDWQKVPIVLFSSLSAEELRGVLEGLEYLNVAAYLYKPSSTLADLTRTVEEILEPVRR